MHKKHEVQVRNGDGTLVKKINVVLRAEAIGNFCPIFCTYNGKRRLVESDACHLDDPFRCNEADHVSKLFIRPRNVDGHVVPTWKEAK